ncbi:hypothetical protein [Myxosarcina sp. GI1(2024)]
MLTKNVLKMTVSTLITLGNLIFLLMSRPLLANPMDIESLQISHPTITPNWLSMGKFLFYQFFSQKP